VPDAISHADIVGGAIVLQAPLAALLLCRRIPGGRWDAIRRAWVYPATERHARLIGSLIPRLQSSAAFNALAGVPPAVPEVNVPQAETTVIDTILLPGLTEKGHSAKFRTAWVSFRKHRWAISTERRSPWFQRPSLADDRGRASDYRIHAVANL